jgi:anti-sigma regulatory factor (Ser/Thr protein kinase)
MDVAVRILPSRRPLRFVMDDASKVGEARRAAQGLAALELDADVAAKVAIAATELANNLIRHAGGGDFIIQRLGDDAHAVVELLAVDRGCGMADVARCMTDGFSTAGTAGTGLGAVRRLASEFDIHSQPGEGTVVMARFGASLPVRHGVINVALEGEPECGDAWHVAHGPEGIAVFVVDGLGHGAFAAEAARAGVDAFLAAPFSSPQETMTRANAAMSKTRGGAAAVALVRGDAVSYAGIGNISGVLIAAGRSQGLVSHNGTLGTPGMNPRRTQQFEYRREPQSLLVLHSDGLSARWDLKNRADLLRCHPAVVAAALWRDHRRDRDDATVVVLAP